MDRSVVFPILFVIIATTGIVLLKREERNQTYRVNARVIALDSVQQIRFLDDSLVKPFLYTNISGFEKLPQQEAKLKFISAVLPAILIARHDIETSRIKVKKLLDKKEWNKSDSVFSLT
jgi:Bax protein